MFAFGRTRIAFECIDETFAELLFAAQQTGVQYAEQTPEFAEMIFQRRAGGGDAEIGLQATHRLRTLGGRILDGLGFIEHEGGKRDLLEMLDLGNQHAVTDQHHIAGIQTRQCLFAIAIAIHAHVQRGRKTQRFAAPVADHTGRCNHQSRTFGGACRQHRQGLHGFAKAHVVGQTGTRTPAGEAHQKTIAIELVIAQIGLKIRRHFRVVLLRAIDALQLLAEFDVEFALIIKRLGEYRRSHWHDGDLAIAIGKSAQQFQTPAQLTFERDHAFAVQPQIAALRRTQLLHHFTESDDTAVIQSDATFGGKPVALTFHLYRQRLRITRSTDTQCLAGRPFKHQAITDGLQFLDQGERRFRITHFYGLGDIDRLQTRALRAQLFASGAFFGKCALHATRAAGDAADQDFGAAGNRLRQGAGPERAHHHAQTQPIAERFQQGIQLQIGDHVLDAERGQIGIDVHPLRQIRQQIEQGRHRFGGQQQAATEDVGKVALGGIEAIDDQGIVAKLQHAAAVFRHRYRQPQIHTLIATTLRKQTQFAGLDAVVAIQIAIVDHARMPDQGLQAA